MDYCTHEKPITLNQKFELILSHALTLTPSRMLHHRSVLNPLPMVVSVLPYRIPVKKNQNTCPCRVAASKRAVAVLPPPICCVELLLLVITTPIMICIIIKITLMIKAGLVQWERQTNTVFGGIHWIQPGLS
jgi:hypothetical protein